MLLTGRMALWCGGRQPGVNLVERLVFKPRFCYYFNYLSMESKLSSVIEFARSASKVEFIELIGCIDVNLSCNPELANLVLTRISEIGFEFYDRRLADNLKRLVLASNYIPELSSPLIYVLWVLGDYDTAHSIAKDCIRIHSRLESYLARNLIFLAMTEGNHQEARKVAELCRDFSGWLPTIGMIQSGEYARVGITGFEETAFFYLSCFSTQSLEAALTHGSGHFCEEEELIATAEFAKSKRILEIGTLVGNHSVFFAKFCKANHITCVDLNPKSCITTRLNLLINKYDKQRFSIINARAGGPGMATMGQGSVSNFCLGVDTCEIYDFIKIDIDGGELSFIKASLDYIKLRKPTIFCEIQDRNYNFIFDSLMACGYTHETLRSRNFGEKNILFKPIS